MLMMGMGKMGSGLALSSILDQQQNQQRASDMQKEAQAKRAEILATPQTPAGYSQSLASNIVNPRTGLFNVKYGTYFTPHYADGGRVGMADGGDPRIERIARGIAAVESRGEKDPYASVGARSRKGDYPYGKYQIMGANIPEWGRAAGYPGLTIQQFRHSPEIQEAVARHQFGKMLAKSGNPNAVAGEWLGGPDWRHNRSADVLGTTVPAYMKKFASAYGHAPNAVASYGHPASAPVRVLATRPVTGERANVVAADRPSVAGASAALPPSATLSRINPADRSGPLLGSPAVAPTVSPVAPAPPRRPGFSLSDFSPIGSAHADEMAPTLPQGVIPRIRPGFESIQGPSQLAGLQAIKQLSPSSLEPASAGPKTGISGLDMERFVPPGMAGDRDLMGATPQGFGTFGPTDFSSEASAPSAPWDAEPVISRDVPAAAEAPAPARAPEPQAPAEKGKFWGDYRDYEPWSSDPIGKALDDIMGEKPMATHKGASMWDTGGGETERGGFDLGDLFRQFGGRVNMQDGGDPLAYLDPEMFSGESMSDQPAGFGGLEDQPENRVVATDMPERPVQPEQGLGGLRSPITGQPMVWGPASQALLAAGLGMMASDRVNPLQAIGEGGLQGLKYYQEASAQERAQQAADERMRRELAKERASELHWQADQQHKKNVLEAMERARAAGKIGVIGRDEFGNPKYGWVSGEKVGSEIEPTGATVRPGGADTSGLHYQDYLDTMDPQRADRIKAIAEGREQLPQGRYMEPIRQAVTQYDPNFSQQRFKVREEFANTGQTHAGGQIMFGNTALGHLGELSDDAHRLGNTGFRAWNWVKQHGKQALPGGGNPNLDAFEATKDRFIEEATKFYRGTGGTEADIQRAINRLSSASTPQELDAVIAKEAKLFESKISSLENHWRKHMGSMEIPVPDYEIKSNEAKKAMEKIQARAAGKSPTSIEEAAKKFGMTPEQIRAKYEEMKKGRQ